MEQQLKELQTQLAAKDAQIARLRKSNQILRKKQHGASLAYPAVIANLTNNTFSVEKGSATHASIIAEIAAEAITAYNASGIFQGRVNEFGNHMENFIVGKGDVEVHKPKTLQGKQQDTGYPDRFVIKGSLCFYLEIKVFKEGSESSSFRTFYLCSGKKITRSCPHYLLGFEHSEKTLTGNIHVVDMFDKTLQLKSEWATHNKELYVSH